MKGDVVEIITKRWDGDAPSTPDGESHVLLGQRVFINGREVVGISRARVIMAHQEFSHVMLRLYPGELIVRDVEEDEFDSYQPEVLA